MYLQITTRCNMLCAHCCMAATKHGEDMTLKTVKAALNFAYEQGEEVLAIGGGEPTIHPKFWEIFGLTVGNPHLEYVWMATNGKRKQTALSLCQMAKKGVLGVALSLDAYHDPIDPEVIQAFKEGMRPGGGQQAYPMSHIDRREVRDVTKGGEVLPIINGRWQEEGRENCCCDALFVKPNGDVLLCGCDNSLKIGDVWSKISRPENIHGDIITCVKQWRLDQEARKHISAA